MEPPVVAKQETLSKAITMVITGNSIDLLTLKTMARQVESELRAIDGISQVEISGFPDEEIVIAIDETILRQYNLTFQEVSQAVAQTNLLITGGSVKTKEEEYLIRLRNRAYYAKELENIVIKAFPNGSQIKLTDVAKVSDTWSETPNRSYFNGNPSITIDVSTTNTEDFIDAANKTLVYVEAFNERNQNASIEVTSNRTITVIQRTELLVTNGIQGVILVLFFFPYFFALDWLLGWHLDYRFLS